MLPRLERLYNEQADSCKDRRSSETSCRRRLFHRTHGNKKGSDPCQIIQDLANRASMSDSNARTCVYTSQQSVQRYVCEHRRMYIPPLPTIGMNQAHTFTYSQTNSHSKFDKCQPGKEAE